MRRSWTTACILLVATLTSCQHAPSNPGPGGVLYPGTFNLQVATGGYAIHDCAEILARAFSEEEPVQQMECALFFDRHGLEDENGWLWASEPAISAYFDPLERGGWRYGHLAVREHYFVRTIEGTDCQDVMVVLALQPPEIEALLASRALDEDVSKWRGIAIPTETGQRCGDERWPGERWRDVWDIVVEELAPPADAPHSDDW